jgi:beta-lactamase regulating signal transducer with metallopeptidase domain/protein involved in polysaccharide export with SLBB domain
MTDAAALALAHFLWQGTGLALVAAVLMRVARRSASARYAIGVGTLWAMAAAPILTTIWLMPAATGTRPVETFSVTATTLTLTESTPDPATTLAEAIAPQQAATPFPYATAILLAWAVGVLLLSARLAGGWFITYRLATRDVQPVMGELQQTARRLAAQLRLSRPVRILESSAVAVPVMIGFLKPVVLLPAAAIAGLAPDQLEALIAHELAHVRRHDYLVNLLQSLVETMLFYHPAVWWMSHRVRTEREHCCDDLAVRVTDKLTYVTALSHVAALTAPGVALAASDGSLRGRVRRLLGPERDRRSGGAWLAVLPVVVVIAAASPLARTNTIELPEPPALVQEAVTPAQPEARPVGAADAGPEVAAPLRAQPSPAFDAIPGLPVRLSADTVTIVAHGNVSLQVPPAPPAAAPQAPKAPLKPGETVVINVEGRPELSGTYVVQPDGSIKLKGVEPAEFEVQVNGAVRSPGVQRISGENSSVGRAIAQAGGYARNAGTEIEIHRRVADGSPPRVIIVTREQLDMNEDPGVQAGDRVNVKVGRVFSVNGEVNAKGEKVWAPGMTVSRALVLSGGQTSRFSLRRSHIVRPVKNSNGAVLRYDKISDLKPETPVLPDDIVVAGRMWM